MSEGLGVIAWILGVALVPLALVVLTSFAKFAIVLTILRNALGAPGLPPGVVITALAALFTVFVMAPVAQDVFQAIEPDIHEAGTAEPTADLADISQRATTPVRAFLQTHARPEDRRAFAELAASLHGERTTIRDDHLLVLAPAFAISELREAFLIGVMVLIPFLIIDLVIASILVVLGLHSMPLASVALPIKLVLFVVVDGWQVLLSGLVAGYTS